MRRVIAIVLLAAVLAGGTGLAAYLTTARLIAAAPQVAAGVSAPATWVAAPGVAPPIAAPAQGSLAVDSVIGATPRRLLSSDAETVRPIASVTKTMTALVVLEQHQLAVAQEGPVVTMTSLDVSDYNSIAAAGGSVAPVSLGESFSERDLLLGLMLPSANNLALTLARWVDGSVAAFVARLNARAVALGMTHTHFDDPDGLSAATTSTAADLVRLGEAAVASDTLTSIMSTARATLPDGTVVTNLDTLLGAEPGWVGIKTGWTPQAGGCLLFAARRLLAAGAPPLTIVGAVLDQLPDAAANPAHPELGAAFVAARAAVRTAFAGYTTVAAAAVPASGSVLAPWGAASGLVLRAPDRLLVHVGDTLAVTATPRPVTVPVGAGTTAGTVTLTAAGTVVGRWPLATATSLAAPSAWWRLLHG